MKMKKFIGILFTTALMLGLIPGMSLTASADGQHYIYNEISAIIPGLTITKNGTTVTEASSGETITLTITGQPETGEIGDLWEKTDRVIASRSIMVDGLSAYKADGTAIPTNSTGSQTWTFTMPDENVYVAFPPLTEGEAISIIAGGAAFRTGFANLASYCFYTHKTDPSSSGDSFGYLAYKDTNNVYKYTSNDDTSGNLNFKIPFQGESLTIQASTFYHLGLAEYHSDRSGTFTIPPISTSMDIPFGTQEVQPQTVTANDIAMLYGETQTIKATTDGNGTLSYKVINGDDIIDVNFSNGVITTKKDGTATVKITASATTTYAEGTKEITVTVKPSYNAQGVEHIIGDSSDAVITVKGAPNDDKTYDKFESVSVGGKKVDAENYDKVRGSLVLTLKGSFLNTLSVGDYKVKITFTDGTAETNLKIIAATPTPTITPTPSPTPKPMPKTGDSGNPMLWLLIALLGISLLCVTVKQYSRK